jgi:hypothetical protein
MIVVNDYGVGFHSNLEDTFYGFHHINTVALILCGNAIIYGELVCFPVLKVLVGCLVVTAQTIMESYPIAKREWPKPFYGMGV